MIDFSYLVFGFITYMIIIGIIRLVYIILALRQPKICRGCLIKAICEKSCDGWFESFAKKDRLIWLLEKLEFKNMSWCVLKYCGVFKVLRHFKQI